MSQIRPMAIINAACVITGDGVTSLERASVLLAAGRIEAVVQTERPSLSEDYALIDAAGCTVLPGLINAHAHGCVCGPTMPRSMMCGGIVVPELAVPPDASDQSCGLMRSSYGPSPRLTNATETRCGPAVTWSGSVRKRSTPSGRSVRTSRSNGS